jgi:DUF218 domain
MKVLAGACIARSTRILQWVYDRLAVSTSPTPADLIFVLAGKMERKEYGLKLYRAGFAQRLLLSVGRFEVSKMWRLDSRLATDLIAERGRTPPEQRHFFCLIDLRRTLIYKPDLPKWNTYGEALALREYLAREPVTSAIVVSTDIHIRRVALAFEKVFRHSTVKFTYCAVPECWSSVSKNQWWARRDDRTYVIAETVKTAIYRVILLLPEFAIRAGMRLWPDQSRRPSGGDSMVR